MRNYWLRIALGAVAIFTVGMLGVTLARQGVGRVRGVVEGSGPITLPLAFIPFKLDGQRLGSVNKVVLLRDAPKRISAVELEIKLTDSTLASGLAGCNLAANFEAEHKPGDVRVNRDPFSSGVFSCLDRSDSVPQFQVFGRAIFQPGDVTVPLLLPNDIVDDLEQGNFGPDGDSVGAVAEARADSIAEAASERADSIAAAIELRASKLSADSAHAVRRLVDSLRAEGMRRRAAAQNQARRQADSAQR